MRNILLVVALVLTFVLGWKINDLYYDDEYNYDKLEAYQHYYTATEDMLDSIMYHYNIVRKVDTSDYADALMEVWDINRQGNE